MKRKRILYIHNTYPYSEEANLIQVLHMCNALSKIGNIVTLALPRNFFNRDNYECKNVLENNIGIEINFDILEYVKFTPFNRIKFLGGLFGILKIVKKRKYDFCIIRHAPYVGLALLNDYKIVYEAHNDAVHGRSILQNAIWTWDLVRKSRSDKLKLFLCISDELKEAWQKKGIPEQKLKVLHDGFSYGLFNKKITKNNARKQLKLPFQKTISLYVGSLYKDRGIEFILKLAMDFKDVLFVIIGGPQQEQKNLIDEAKQSGVKNIQFIGRIKNTQVPLYLYAADVLLMIWTSKVETINFCSPLKLFEYMASGTTIVGFGFKTIHEVLAENEDSLLAEPENYKDLRNKFETALNAEDIEQYGNNARVKAFDKYTWDIRAKRLISCLYD